MIKLYLTSCTKANEHEMGHRLAKYALYDTYGKRAELSHDERGKPYFVGEANIFISVSHSNERCLAAISDGEIGADIEYMNGDATRLVRLAERYFTPSETEYVKLAPETRFYEIWCAKESYIKYTGEGFSRPLSSFSVLESDLCFSHFTKSGYAVCICAEEAAAMPPRLIML
ncbi:MAG: 4'-phosphopantetheinyl transferase superfamily protein [Clostridia bacterium]|nr:4'-phosphopantetheinyl transferase superfamily protein [Clostridia bacterium]